MTKTEIENKIDTMSTDTLGAVYWHNFPIWKLSKSYLIKLLICLSQKETDNA